jgi:protein phosphatase
MKHESAGGGRIRAACCSDRGLVRRSNEDNYWFDGNYMDAGSNSSEGILCADYEWPQADAGSGLFFAVFDGVGGSQFGEQASMAAAMEAGHFLRAFDGTYKGPPGDLVVAPGDVPTGDLINDAGDVPPAASRSDDEALPEALYRNMNRAVLQKRDELGVSDSCTTAVSLLFHDGSVCCSNAGDSRCYMAADGELIRLSTTHTNEQAFALLGITGIKPMLTQFLGMEPAASGPGTGHSASGAGAKPGALCFRPSHHELPAERGTTFLLCTDGLTDMVSEDRILTILTSGSSPEESVRKLRDEALQRGGRDNITIIVASLT